jgi:hypothetical protein
VTDGQRHNIGLASIAGLDDAIDNFGEFVPFGRVRWFVQVTHEGFRFFHTVEHVVLIILVAAASYAGLATVEYLWICLGKALH